MKRTVPHTKSTDVEAATPYPSVYSLAPYGAKRAQEFNPTQLTYASLDGVHSYLNRTLFGGTLPDCLISLQRKRGARGYFDAKRFQSTDGDRICDEIALNPRHWGPPRDDKESISTLAHEMVHQWQAIFGKPGRGGYHNREFARKMWEIGLVASSTGAPGGNSTGRRVSHYIFKGGAFDRACDRLLGTGFRLPYAEVSPTGTDMPRPDEDRRRTRAESKTAYVCPHCSPPPRVWGKPRLAIKCGTCDSAFVADQHEF